jgi:hypothetical protein
MQSLESLETTFIDAGGMAEVIEHLPSKYKAWVQTPEPPKKEITSVVSGKFFYHEADCLQS